MHAWTNRRCAGMERGSATRRPTGSGASSSGKRCNLWPAYDRVSGHHSCLDWREGFGLRTARPRHALSESHHIWPVEIAAVLGPSTRRPALRKHRQLPRAKKELTTDSPDNTDQDANHE